MTLGRTSVRSATRNWTRAPDLIEALRRRWERGVYLRAYAAGEPWTPVSLPVKAPDARELLDRLDEARQWLNRFQREASGFDIEYKTVQGRQLGANRLPARVTANSLGQLAAVLGTTAEVCRFDELVAETESQVPALVPWLRANPMTALRNAAVWEQALAAVRWVATHDTVGLYVRQVDMEGVDTKFVERHHRLLDQLLRAVLPAERIGSASGFAAKFGFATKPSYTRLRFLDPALELVPGLSELTARTEELLALTLDPERVFVVENEVTYLAFPAVPRSVVIFGSGFALAGLVRVNSSSWLSDRQIVYWGDIDTHGFSILSRLRGVFPSVRSMLMDRQTLLAHRGQWVTEDAPTRQRLANLTPDEVTLYRDLVEGTYGDSVRFEQERVRFSLLGDALFSKRSA